MNKLNYLLLIGFVLGFMALASCGGDDTPPLDPVEEVTKRFSGTWVVDVADPTSVVMYGSEDRTDAYASFSITFNSNGTYSTTSAQVDQPTPWPASGGWEFTNPDNITNPEQNSFSITRTDGLVITVNLSGEDSVLDMQFNFDPEVHDGTRVDGNWQFVLVAQ